MTQDRIIDMAKQAGFHFHDAGYGPEVLHTEPHEYSQKCFERFAALLRAQTLEEAAGVCENTLAQHYMKQVIPTHDEALLLAACADCAAAIRARGAAVCVPV